MIPKITLGEIAILPIIGIWVSLLKGLGVSSRYLPLCSVISGILLGLMAYYFDSIPLIQGLVGGMIIGASVSGLYDFGKKTILNK